MTPVVESCPNPDGNNQANEADKVQVKYETQADQTQEANTQSMPDSLNTGVTRKIWQETEIRAGLKYTCTQVKPVKQLTMCEKTGSKARINQDRTHPK